MAASSTAITRLIATQAQGSQKISLDDYFSIDVIICKVD